MNIENILLDDHAAFRKAKEYGLAPLKSFDILMIAKKKGLIQSVRNVMDTMKKNNEGIDPVQYDKMIVNE